MSIFFYGEKGEKKYGIPYVLIKKKHLYWIGTSTAALAQTTNLSKGEGGGRWKRLLTDFYFHVLEVLSYVETRLFVEGIPSKSTISLNRGDFKLVREVMAMSIVQH